MNLHVWVILHSHPQLLVWQIQLFSESIDPSHFTCIFEPYHGNNINLNNNNGS